MSKPNLFLGRGWILVAVVLVLGCGSGRKKNVCRNPNFTKALKEQAIVYYRRGNYIAALKSAKEAEACKPKDAELYYWIGLIYFQREKTYDAIESLQKSLAIDPGFVESHMALGVSYLELERWDEAIFEFEAAVNDELFERPWEAYNNMGWAYFQKGELALAEVNFKKATRLNARYFHAYCNLGELYSKQGRRSKAIENYKKAVALCPQNYARPHFLLAIEYGRRGSYNIACSELYEAAKVVDAPEAEQARDYMRLYNCPAMARVPPGR